MRILSLAAALAILSAMPAMATDYIPSPAASAADARERTRDPDVDLEINDDDFEPGDTQTLDIEMNYDGYAYLLDVYVALLTPWNDIYFLDQDCNIVWEVTPISCGWDSAGYDWHAYMELYLPWIPEGWYTWYGIVVMEGANVFYDYWVDYETVSWYFED